jgi:hypothetical protein
MTKTSNSNYASKPVTPSKAPGKGLTQRTKAWKILVAMVEDGKIKPATTAMDIYEEDEEFRKYDKDVFRSAFQRVKNKKGVYLRNGK